MRIIDRIRKAITNRDYRVSSHAAEELADDWLEFKDVESVIFTGTIEKGYTRDPRGTRYQIRGRACDGRDVIVICRFQGDGVLIIITAYEMVE